MADIRLPHCRGKQEFKREHHRVSGAELTGMKYLVIGLASIQGLWMLLDGIYVIANGKYIGPEKPGPWASLIGLTGVDVFKLGPVFVFYGVAWLVFVGGFIAGTGWARTFGILLSVLTLWYLPIGTLISLIVLGTLIFFVKS